MVGEPPLVEEHFHQGKLVSVELSVVEEPEARDGGLKVEAWFYGSNDWGVDQLHETVVIHPEPASV